MGYRVAADGAGFAGALLGHEAGQKAGAYDADERRSTHPVAPDPEDVPDVDSAAGVFDAISYAKGNSVIRQLVTWLGDETFLRGVNTYLTRHRFANATLADFVAALDEASDRDVRAWVEVWLRRTGFDALRVERDGEVPVLHRDGVRPHRVRVTAYDEDWREVSSELVDVADEPVPLPDLAGRVVVPNAQGETFARVVLDQHSGAAVSAGMWRIGDDLTRAVLWTMLFDRVQTRDLDPTGYVDLLERHLPAERSATIVTAAVNRTLGRVLPLRVPAEAAGTALARLAGAAATGLAGATTPELALAFAAALAPTSSDAGRLLGWLDSGTVGDLPLSPTLRWRVVRRLAELGAADAALVEVERRRTPGTEAEVGAAAALAARPTVEAKDAAWAVVSDPAVDNRLFTATMGGLWSPGQEELLAPYVDRYLRQAPRWAGRGASFAQVVGQQRPAIALTGEQLALLDRALAGDLPTVLRRHWEDWRDDLG
jgi:aminopeptidase N